MEWNQDERFGAFGGAHAMVVGGYGQLTEAMAKQIRDIRYNSPVTKIEYCGDGVRVHIADGTVIPGDAVIVSVPIGVLQRGNFEFVPELPGWKREALSHIGMGKLNKVSLGTAALSVTFEMSAV
jgi:monoamine oxidase